MNALAIACRGSVLVMAVSVIGMPVPAGAAGEGRGGASARQPQLTINGRPLSRLLYPTLTTGGGEDGRFAEAASTNPSSGVLKLRVGDAVRVPQAVLLTRSQPGSSPNRSWIKRHPVLFGTIVGAAAGAAIVGATVDAEASFVGFYGGGAAGAAVGWVVSR